MFQIPYFCTGCYACVSVCPHNCISMITNEEGFLFPVIDVKKCVRCNLCEKVCPVLYEQKRSISTQSYAAKSRNEAERINSASGGIFSLLAGHCLNQGGIIFGAVYDENFAVRHIAVTDKKKLHLLQGAKFVQSDIGTSFIEVEKELKSGRPVLFSGTPCQCAGLKAYLGKEYENLLLTDLICHGVPSPEIWQKYIEYRSEKENRGRRPLKINMRSKASGWSNYGYSTEFDYGQGYISRVHNGQDLFMKAFVGNICLRPSCSNCREKGVERCTDLTLGDYWGIWKQYPEFDDDKGISVIFVHSKKGHDVLKQLGGDIEYFEVNIQDAYQENPSLVAASKVHEKRRDFFEKVSEENFGEVIDEFFPSNKPGFWRLLQKVKRKKVRTLIRIIFVIIVLLLADLWISSNYMVTREYSVDISDKEGKIIQAVVISDLHDHEFGSNNKDLVKKIIKLQPDVIFMVGDMLNSGSASAAVPCELIRQISGIAPVYFSLGNHEKGYISAGHINFTDQLEEAGAVVLDKEYMDIEVNGVPVRLGGMYDYAFGLDGNDTALTAPEEVLSFLQEYQNTDRTKIMLSHRPESFVFGDASETWKIDLILCGHIHGGQVVIPFIGGLYGGDQEWLPQYVHGVYGKDNFKLFITSGLGSDRQMLPRFNNPPEIASVEIKV